MSFFSPSGWEKSFQCVLLVSVCTMPLEQAELDSDPNRLHPPNSSSTFWKAVFGVQRPQRHSHLLTQCRRKTSRRQGHQDCCRALWHLRSYTLLLPFVVGWEFFTVSFWKDLRMEFRRIQSRTGKLRCSLISWPLLKWISYFKACWQGMLRNVRRQEEHWDKCKPGTWLPLAGNAEPFQTKKGSWTQCKKDSVRISSDLARRIQTWKRFLLERRVKIPRSSGQSLPFGIGKERIKN